MQGVDVLYCCSESWDGIARYSHSLANALCEAGARVTMLGTRAFECQAGARYRFEGQLPASTEVVQPVDWLRYSLAEDVELSSRISKQYRLLNTIRARLFHLGLGSRTHPDWSAIGEMAVLNRHLIMTRVLGRSSLGYHIQFILYEFGYQTLASLWNNGQWGKWSQCIQSLRGKFRGLWNLRATALPTLMAEIFVCP